MLTPEKSQFNIGDLTQMKLSKKQKERAKQQSQMLYVHIYKSKGYGYDSRVRAVCDGPSPAKKPVLYTNRQPSRVDYETVHARKGKFKNLLLFRIVFNDDVVELF